MAVVAAFELDNFVTAGEAAGQANGAHGGFGTGVHHADHIHGRDQLGDQRRHFNFHLRRRAKAQAAFGGFNDRVADGRMVMTQHHWAPGADIIDIRFTINVVKVSAVGALDKQRRTADAGERTYRRVHAAGNKFTRSVIQIFRFAHCQGPGS